MCKGQKTSCGTVKRTYGTLRALIFKSFACFAIAVLANKAQNEVHREQKLTVPCGWNRSFTGSGAPLKPGASLLEIVQLGLLASVILAVCCILFESASNQVSKITWKHFHYSKIL